MENFKSAEDFYSAEYDRGDEDGNFTLGEQWPEDAKQKRKNRPMLTENRTLAFVNQVVNSIRQARPSAVVKPVDDNGDPKIAEILKGVIRNIEKAYKHLKINAMRENIAKQQAKDKLSLALQTKKVEAKV